jgi:hypothetical protein
VNDILKKFVNMTPVLEEKYLLYRTPVLENKQTETTYVVWPTDNLRREFASSSMPKEVKLKLGMVKAYDGNMSRPVLRDWQLSAVPAYIYTYTTYPDNFNDIGWKVSDSVYCLVLSNETLTELKGTS